MTEVIHVQTTVEVPLFGGAKMSKFKTLEEWLLSICDGKKLEKSISDYSINLAFSDSSSSRKYKLCIYGENTYEEENITRIEFKPLNMFLALPKKGYKDLDYEKIKEKITMEFKSFIKTEKFKTSFLSKGNITIGFSEETIWPNNHHPSKFGKTAYNKS